MNYLEKAKVWQNFKGLDANLKAELDKMSDDDLKEAFTNDLEFGTGGLRGILGVGTNRMNIYIVEKATLGFGRYLLKQSEVAQARGVAIAHDNRHYSVEFARKSAEVLTSLGFRVFLFEALRPTPELSYAVRNFKCIGGIMITASHNPKEYNGYKIYDETGCQLVPDMANKVIEEINKIDDIFNIETTKNHDLIYYIGKDVDEKYIADVKKIILRPNLNKDFRLIYTPLHGTGQVFAPDVLKSVGYNVLPLPCQMTNDPNFSGVKTSNPENKEAYDEAIALAKAWDADIVLATDPDADRLGIAVRHNGEFILFTGNQTATLELDYILRTRKEFGTLPKDGYLFTTNVSSTLPEVIAKKYGLKVEITLTGFKFIGEKAREMEQTGRGTYVFGFEESYGSLVSPMVRDKDSIQAILILCELAAYWREKGLDLVEALDKIYQEYGYFKEDITNVALAGLAGKAKIERIMDFFRNNEIKLDGFNILAKDDVKLSVHTDVKGNKSEIKLPKSNVIKYYLNDDMWFVLRPSGTEPKLKIYYGVNGKSHEESNAKLQALKKQVLDIFNTIE